jgi:hypothetical protein
VKGKNIDPLSLLAQLLRTITPSRIELSRERERQNERNRASKVPVERRNKQLPKT